MLVESPEVAFAIQDLFSSKLSLIVFDLTTYSNYTAQSIDNEVCLNWQIPVVDDLNLIKTSEINVLQTQVQTVTQQELIQTPLRSALTIDRQKDLQLQLMLVYQLLRVLGTTTLREDLAQVCRTEISVVDIEQQLATVAKQNLNTLLDLRTAKTVLMWLGKTIYE
jgi:hypothetical protein